MNFIVDAQLPPALVEFLRTRHHTAIHVADLGLAAGNDDTIWEQAKQTGAVIISKDEDFMVRTLIAQDNVAVVWVRLGNCSNRALLACFSPVLDDIVHQLQAGETLVEISG